MFKNKFKLALFENNQGFMKWLINATGYLDRTKDLKLCFHFAQELHEETIFDLVYVILQYQIANVFTNSTFTTNYNAILDKNQH